MSEKLSKIYRALAWEDISVAVLDTTSLVNEAIRRHGLSPLASAALGRTLTAAAYLCSWLKSGTSSLSVTIDGGGAGGKIAVSGDGDLNLRGYIEHPDVMLPLREDGKLNVGGCVGRNGTLTVIRDDGEGIPFVGTCGLVSGEIAEDFSAYFFTSEQRPTAIALGVRMSQDNVCLGAGGVFLQPLPGASDESITQAENCIQLFANISKLIAADGAEKIMSLFPTECVSEREIVFRCHCSRERAERALLSVGEEEARAILRDEGKISIHCHDCNTDYLFDAEDVGKIFSGKEAHGKR